MSEPKNEDPYRVPESTRATEDPGDVQPPGVLAIVGIVIVSLGAGFTGFFGTCFGGVLAANMVSHLVPDFLGAGFLLIALLSMAVGLWVMIVTSRALYRAASRMPRNRR